LELTTAINTLANVIACKVDDDGALNLLGALLTQLGDTVTTIATQRDFCSKIEESNGEKESTDTKTSPQQP